MLPTKRVLVVDDQASIRNLLEEYLVTHGYSVATAANGESALLALTRPEPCSLVLLDLDFGPEKLHGLDVLTAIREMDPQLPVIILTGQATILLAVKAMQLGARDFIEKDWNIEENLGQSLRRLREHAQHRIPTGKEWQRLQRIEREISEARLLQRSILPSADPVWPPFEVSSGFLAASEITGDYYDFLELSPSRVAIAMGDGQGHGVSAGLLVSTAAGCLRTILESTQDPLRVFEAMNRRIAELRERVFMTFCHAEFDREDLRVTLTLAGHHPPYHYAYAERRLLPWETEGSFPLGIRRTQHFPQLVRTLSPGDVLLFYSDGAVEAPDREERPFGHEALEQLLVEKGSLSASSITDHVLARLSAHRGTQIPVDDTTVIAVKVVG